MAIDYPTLFADIGSIITEIDRIWDMAVSLNSPRPDLVTGEQSIQDQLTKPPPPDTPRGRFGVLSGMDLEFEGYKDQAVEWCSTLAARIDALLLDEDTVWSNLPGMGGGVTLDRVLVELFNDMLINQQTVNRNVVTIAAPTYGDNEVTDPTAPQNTNNGDGVVFTSKRLDGNVRAGRNLRRQLQFAGLDSEMTVSSEELVWTCQGDQFSTGTVDGGESFLLESRPRLGGEFSWQTEGSGERLNVQTFNSVGTLLDNQDFEDWEDSSTPSGWDKDSGTILQESAPSTNVFRGDSSLKFVNTGKISQSVTDLVPRQMYVATIAHKGGFQGVLLQFFFEGTLADGSTYVASGEERFDAPIGTDWDQSVIFYLTPDQPMEDGKLTVSAAGELWIDSMTLGPVQYIGGVATCIVAGQKPWVVGDRARVAISNDDAGKFQRFWRKHYGRQLPSDINGTIDEPTV